MGTPHGDGQGSDTLLGDVACLAAVAVRAHEQRVVDALVEHGRDVRPSDCRHGGQRGDRATLDRPTDHGRVRVDDVRLGSVVVVVMPSSFGRWRRRFHGHASLIVCRSSTTLADALAGWQHGLVAADTLTVPAVSDALRHITITGVFYCPSYLREPWGGTVPAMPGCVWFHAVTSGRCELVVGRDRLQLQAGDLALVPHGAGHRIEAGGPAEHPLIPDLPHEEQSDNYAVLRYGGDGSLTELVCGGLRLEHPSARRLLDGLPPVVHVRTVRRTVLCATLDLLAEEVRGREVGNEAVISRLCDIVVIQAIRHWMTDADATGSPWLRAMGDPQIGPALPTLHAAPAEPWTVGALASRAAMSRSASPRDSASSSANP